MSEEKKDLTGIIDLAKLMEAEGTAPPPPEGSVMEETPIEKIDTFESLEEYAAANPQDDPSSAPSESSSESSSTHLPSEPFPTDQPSDSSASAGDFSSSPDASFPTSESTPSSEFPNTDFSSSSTDFNSPAGLDLGLDSTPSHDPLHSEASSSDFLSHSEALGQSNESSSNFLSHGDGEPQLDTFSHSTDSSSSEAFSSSPGLSHDFPTSDEGADSGSNFPLDLNPAASESPRPTQTPASTQNVGSSSLPPSASSVASPSGSASASQGSSALPTTSSASTSSSAPSGSLPKSSSPSPSPSPSSSQPASSPYATPTAPQSFGGQSQNPALKAVPAAFPFSLLIEGPLTPQEREKILDLVTRENLGIRELDLEPQLHAGRVLIPRISEFAGIYLVQALRGISAQMKLGPSDQIFALSSQETQIQRPKEEVYLPQELDLSHPADQIPITSESEIPSLPKAMVIDTITASGALETHALEAETSAEYQNLVDRLQRNLKYKAYRKGASALVNFKIQLLHLTSPTRYRVLLMAVAVKPKAEFQAPPTSRDDLPQSTPQESELNSRNTPDSSLIESFE